MDDIENDKVSNYKNNKESILKYQHFMYHNNEEFRQKRLQDVLFYQNLRYAINPDFVEWRKNANKKYYEKRKMLKQQAIVSV